MELCGTHFAGVYFSTFSTWKRLAEWVWDICQMVPHLLSHYKKYEENMNQEKKKNDENILLTTELNSHICLCTHPVSLDLRITGLKLQILSAKSIFSSVLLWLSLSVWEQGEGGILLITFPVRIIASSGALWLTLYGRIDYILNVWLHFKCIKKLTQHKARGG